MKKLRFLHLSNVNLTGCYDNFPKSLSWLRWDGFHFCTVTSALYLQNLVVLGMQHSKLKYCWKGIKFLGVLKILNLSHSHALVRTPNFKGLPSLERLFLKGCVNLVEVDESIVDLQRLVLLNLKGCQSLKALQLYKRLMTTIQVLHQHGISNIFLPGNEVPKWFSHQNNGALFSFVVPAAANVKMLGLSLCSAYAFDVEKPWRVIFVEISNKTKGLQWPYRPKFYGVPDTNHEVMLWLSLWKFKEDEFEAGDEIEVSMQLSFCVTVKEIGIRLIHQQDAIHSPGTERLYVWDEQLIAKADPFLKLCHVLNSTPEAGQSELAFRNSQAAQTSWKLGAQF